MKNQDVGDKMIKDAKSTLSQSDEKKNIESNCDNKKDLKKEEIPNSFGENNSNEKKNEIEEDHLNKVEENVLKDKTEENNQENKTEETPNEETLEIDDLIKEYIPDFVDIISVLSKDNRSKVQDWMKNKILKGMEDVKSLEKSKLEKKKETDEKLKSKYGDSFSDIKQNVFSLLPDDFEIDPEYEFDLIEKLYGVYKRLESKPPIHAKNVQSNPWEAGSPLINSTHPDHKVFMSRYLENIS